MMNLDHTLLIQLVNFLIAMVVLNWVLIKPVRNQIAARKAIVAGYEESIDKFTADAAAKISNYESSLAEARTQASLAREALKAEGAVAEQNLVRAAHDEAQAYLQTSREQVAKDAKAATDALLSQVNVFAAKAMNKILG
jgi:F-type H+-transporting ATPase subunit b